MLLIETIFLNFCRYSCKWKQLFPARGNGVFIKSFIDSSAYGFWVNFKLCACLQSTFFFSWKALLKLNVNQIFSIFQVLTVQVAFPTSGSGFSIECYPIRRVEADFLSSVLIFRANFVLVETMIEGKVRLFLIKLSFSFYCKSFSTRFLFFFIYICDCESIFFLA